jgi:hypothetical protein
VLAKGRAGTAPLSGMPSDFWPFPRHFTARPKSEARWLGEAQCAPGGRTPSDSAAQYEVRLKFVARPAEGTSRMLRRLSG